MKIEAAVLTVLKATLNGDLLEYVNRRLTIFPMHTVTGAVASLHVFPGVSNLACGGDLVFPFILS